MRAATESVRDQLRLLDERGCLTAEAMCFVEELLPQQRAVLERHVQACPLCAQQHALLSRTAARLRSARPRVSMPLQARTTARQAALRGALARRAARRRRPRPASRVTALPRHRWPRLPGIWLAALVAMVLVAALVAVVAWFH